MDNESSKTLHPHLPDEIMEEILSRLPVKSLLRLRCVLKSWCYLIDSRRFIKSHLHQSKSCPKYERWQTLLFYRPNCSNIVMRRCSMRSYWDDHPLVIPPPIDDPIIVEDVYKIKIVGHSNGLVCILNSYFPQKPISFFLWNPATRISIELPKLDICDNFLSYRCSPTYLGWENYIIKYGFGCDSQSDEYKVIFVVCNKNKIIGHIYSSKTNSWKILDQHGSVDAHSMTGEFVCGRMHWLVTSGYIETFDLKSEVFGRIELPVPFEFKGFGRIEFPVPGDAVGHRNRPRIRLDGRGGCLSFVYNAYLDHPRRRVIWEMKRYGVKESWVEMSSPIPFENESTYHVWEIDEGEVKFSPRRYIPSCHQTYFFIESLVSPNA